MQDQLLQKEGKANQGQKQQRPKGDTKIEGDKIDSVFLAKELILGDESQFAKRLLEYKSLKNQNYQKFTDRIAENLIKSKFSFARSFQNFTLLSKSADNQNTTGHQMAAIFQGFSNYWKQLQVTFDELKEVLAFSAKVYVHIIKKYIACCYELIVRNAKQKIQYFESEALKLVNTFLKNQYDDHNRVLPLIFEFELYQSMTGGKIVDIALLYSNPADIAYIFVSHQNNLRYNLIQMFIDRCTKNDDTKKCQSIIKCLKLDPFKFQNLIQRLKEKYINYQYRTNRLFFIELAICYDLDLVQVLVRNLQRSGKNNEAKYFVINYHLNQKDFGYFNISPEERKDLLQTQNILKSQDRFGPTQIEVLLQPSDKQLLYLRDFNIFEEDVIFIDQNNISQIQFQTDFSNLKIGIDTQNTGGVHIFDQPQITLLQIYTLQKIFIFDIRQLTPNPQFKQLITQIFSHCKIYGHDHIKQLTALQKDLQLNIQESVMQQLIRARTVDTNKLYKNLHPKDNRSNLVWVCQNLLGKSISKYEQCSGWRNRPLRKAQLHYAALDCVLPVKLGQILQSMVPQQKGGPQKKVHK